MDAQLAAIGNYPTGVKVHNHGVLPAAVVLKLVDMLFVKAAHFVQGVMKLVAGYPCVAGIVKVCHKAVHQVEEIILGGIVMLAVEPVDLVVADEFVVALQYGITYTCRVH